MRRRIALLPLLAACLTAFFGGSLGLGAAQEARAAEERSWSEITEAANGQTVYWNAWGGDERINAYIAWVGERVWDDYGIMVRHVKLADTADAVSRVLAERAADKTEGGSIDLIWVTLKTGCAGKELTPVNEE